MTKIYTKSGDNGTTGLFGNRRVSKASIEADIIGSLDELNSSVGLALAFLPDVSITSLDSVKSELLLIQSDLFHLGSYFAGFETDTGKLSTRTTELETLIDSLQINLSPLTMFILPGGTKFSAQLHMSRAICRRVERSVVSKGNGVNSEVLKYINRLSDFFFVAARMANKAENLDDVFWEKWS